MLVIINNLSKKNIFLHMNHNLFFEAQIDNYSCWIEETNPDIIKSDFKALLMSSGFGSLNFMEHNYVPQGYTCIWSLEESHCAIHTFSEEKIYIDVSSCNRAMYGRFILNLFYLKSNEGAR